MSNLIKGIAFFSFALLLGIAGWGFLFPPHGPGISAILPEFSSEVTVTIYILVAALFFFLSGALIGFLNPNQWGISSVIAWPGMMIGGLEILATIRRNMDYDPNALSLGSAFLLLTAPMAIAIVGGHVGKRCHHLFSRS